MKFFHTADIHFGVENYGKIDATTGIHTRLLDFAKNLQIMVDKAITEDIDFFLFSGDAYKTAQPTPTQQKLLAQLFLQLQAKGIPIVIIVGNHDHPLSFGKANALDVFSYLPVDGFHVFSKPDLKIIPTKSGPVQIIGIPWPTRNYLVTSETHRLKNNQEIADYIAQKISSLIADFATQVDRNIPAILAAHLTVSSGIFSGSEKCAVYGTDPLFMPSQLALDAFDYVALGHLHRHQNLNQSGTPAIVYAGSIERVDFGERNEEKGFCSIVIEKTAQCTTKKTSFTFIKLPTRPMYQIEITITNDSILDQTDQIIASLKKYTLDGAIIKIIYHLPDGIQDRVEINKIYHACNACIFLVGIYPIHQISTVRKKRSIDSAQSTTIPALITTYFEQQENISTIEKNILLKKTMLLIQEIESSIDEQ